MFFRYFHPATKLHNRIKKTPSAKPQKCQSPIEVHNAKFAMTTVSPQSPEEPVSITSDRLSNQQHNKTYGDPKLVISFSTKFPLPKSQVFFYFLHNGEKKASGIIVSDGCLLTAKKHRENRRNDAGSILTCRRRESCWLTGGGVSSLTVAATLAADSWKAPCRLDAIPRPVSCAFSFVRRRRRQRPRSGRFCTEAVFLAATFAPTCSAGTIVRWPIINANSVMILRFEWAGRSWWENRPKFRGHWVTQRVDSAFRGGDHS